MKLSDVKGERCLEVVADLIEPCASIMQDKSAKAIFAPRKVPKGTTNAEFFAKRIAKSAPALIRAHQGDIIRILATIEGVAPEDYEKDLTLAKLLSDFVELIGDEEFLGFLASSAGGDSSEPQPTEQ